MMKGRFTVFHEFAMSLIPSIPSSDFGCKYDERKPHFPCLDSITTAAFLLSESGDHSWGILLWMRHPAPVSSFVQSVYQKYSSNLLLFCLCFLRGSLIKMMSSFVSCSVRSSSSHADGDAMRFIWLTLITEKERFCFILVHTRGSPSVPPLFWCGPSAWFGFRLVPESWRSFVSLAMISLSATVPFERCFCYQRDQSPLVTQFGSFLPDW